MIINQRDMARAKLERLKNGFSTFSETYQVTELLEKYIRDQHLQVHIDRTSFGNWFIPIKD
ncbi:hypothetical protein [Ammoniphilus sp. CFH 90114]|uniref:hypothetical protein n=1 Tax=Ammoniphilus sp. CFH 90114 TaxID=2493665 RepID=UPI00100DB105|nr:hypothetical protein [Ammoniphilus sp. CFH 90114]RXT04794.1 hypothetical protein EIZ39_18885 [Ammoniphilus sp. CFH 90114]